jgi:hypothetical protein
MEIGQIAGRPPLVLRQRQMTTTGRPRRFRSSGERLEWALPCRSGMARRTTAPPNPAVRVRAGGMAGFDPQRPFASSDTNAGPCPVAAAVS